MKHIAAFALLVSFVAGCQKGVVICRMTERPKPPAPYLRQDPALSTAALYAPRHYSAPACASAIAFDGKLDEGAWSAAAWSEPFVDIEGPARATPRQQTRVKMTWDQANLYIGAELAETDLWATLKTHDEIVFQDNDFEVFIDPDGDTREYYEIEVNALGTIFDLYLPETYRAGAKGNHGWTAKGMTFAIALDGTLNDSSDVDRSWTIEMALPWSMFAPIPPAAGTATFQKCARPPIIGDSWRINFSRVQWMLEKQGAGYAKVAGKPEDNWTWTPQWIIDMHVPQWWGVVTFASSQEQAKANAKAQDSSKARSK
ncbi:MAG: carbohydrate-binding family 9-like protein [Phycisphaerales bacterium]|nr:carbohydrate-binding family 9-like protein [Phycisphaerales bacterium]